MPRESVEARADVLDPVWRARRERRAREAVEYDGCLRALYRVGLTVEQVEELTRADVLEMGRLLARANYLAKADRTLMFEIRTPDPMPFTRRSYAVAVVLFVLTTVALIGACGFFGRIIL